MSDNIEESIAYACTICQEAKFSNVCRSNVCLHEFCYDCLKTWAEKCAKCPLCMTNITTLYYKSTVPDMWEAFEIATNKIVILGEAESCAINRSLLENNENDENQNVHTVEETPTIMEEIIHVGPTINGNIRMQVYRQDLWALPFPRTIDYSTGVLRNDPERLYYLRKFVARDISIISLFDTNAFPHSALNTINFIMRSILEYEIEDLMMLFYLFWPYLRSYTLQFCHELYSYVSSSYDISGYDRYVRYYTNDSPYFVYGCQIVPISYEVPSDVITITISDSEDDNSAIERLDAVVQIDTSYRDQPSTSFGAPYSQAKKRTIRQLEPTTSTPGINSAVERLNPIEQIGTSYSDQPSTSFGAPYSQAKKLLMERNRSALFSIQSDYTTSSSDDEVFPAHDTRASRKRKYKKRK